MLRTYMPCCPQRLSTVPSTIPSIDNARNGTA